MTDDLHPVSATKVSRAFGSVKAVSDVTCCLERGRITVFLGANGSGKTTLLRLLAGHLLPSSGEVSLFGNSRRPGSRPLAQSLRQRLGYISQHPGLDPEMTGDEMLALFASLYGLPARRRAIDEAVQRHGLGTVVGQRIRTLSGGQRRRLHLALGMLHNPEILLLDEPTAGLDADGKVELWQELSARAAEGCAVGLVSHDLAAVEELAHHAYLLRDSHLSDHGSGGELIGRHDLRSLAARGTTRSATPGRSERAARRGTGTGGGSGIGRGGCG